MNAFTGLVSIAASQALPSASDVLGILGGIIVALITVAGVIGTWAALRVYKGSGVMANYQAIAASWEKRALAKEAEAQALEEQLGDAMQTITTLQSKVTTLQDLATGHPAVEELSREMKRSFSDLTVQMTRIEDSLKGAGNGGSAAPGNKQP